MTLVYDTDRAERVLARARAFLRGHSRGPMLSVLHQPTYRQQPDPEAMIAGACRVIAADAQADPDNDVVPTFCPDFGTISTAALWGGERTQPTDGGSVHIRTVLKRIEDFASRPIRPFEETDFQKALDLYRRVCERLESDQVFVRTPDVQGPLNTLSLLMDQTALILGMYEEPALFRLALDKITTVLIEMLRRFVREAGPGRVVGNIWPFVIVPADAGLVMTEDFMPLLNPELYVEFGMPCVQRMGREFGGLWLHCCGAYVQHIPALKTLGASLLGLECHYPETKVWDLYDALGDRVALIPYVSPRGQKEFPTLLAWVRHLATRPCRAGRFWFATCYEWEPEAAALRQVVRARFGNG